MKLLAKGKTGLSSVKQHLLSVMLRKSPFGGLTHCCLKVQGTRCLIAACGGQLFGGALAVPQRKEGGRRLCPKAPKTFPVPVFDTPRPLHPAPRPGTVSPLVLGGSSPFESVKCVCEAYLRDGEADGSGGRCTSSEGIDTHLGSVGTRSLKWPAGVGGTRHSPGACCRLINHSPATLRVEAGFLLCGWWGASLYFSRGQRNP